MFPHAALALAFALSPPAKTAPPKDQPILRYAIPPTLPAGLKAKLTLRGARLDTATEVRTDTGKVRVTRQGKVSVSNNYPAEKVGDSEIEVEIELPVDFNGTAVEFTVATPAGLSAPFSVRLGKGANAEKEPNDALNSAQELTLPATVDGTIGRERDADVFKLVGKKGQKLTIAAAALGSPADLLLTVYDGQRQVLITVDDVGGNPDPSATVTLPADGDYYLSLIEAHDLGGTGYGYRLSVK